MFVASIIASIAGIALSVVQTSLDAADSDKRRKIESMILSANKKYGKKSREMQNMVNQSLSMLGLSSDRGGVARDLKRQSELAKEYSKKRDKAQEELDELSSKIDYARGVASTGYLSKSNLKDVESKLGGNI